MNRTVSLLGGIAILALAAGATVPAYANGGDFFNELSESWGANADTGVPFFGWVRDSKGKAIARAIVTATVQDGPDGQSVTIISDNLGHYKIPGLGKDIDPKTDTVLIRTSVPTGAGFRPGQFLSLKVVAEEHRDVLAVPEESVVPGPGGGTVLMVVEGGKAVPRPVKAGLRDGGLTEVEGEGVKEGLVIVTTDAYNISGETKVHIIGNK